MKVSSGSPVSVKQGQRFRNRDDFNTEFAELMMPKFARYGRSHIACVWLYVSLMSYLGLSKLALNAWTKELQRRLIAADVPILVTAPCPGFVHTGVSSTPFVSECS